MQLAFGLSRAIPDDITTAWGARLIAPDDLVWDRQDLVADSSDAKGELIAWLNGENGDGAIAKMRAELRDRYRTMPQTGEEFTLYEDERGKIIGSTNGSHGYVYVCGFLKPLGEHYELIRGPIPAERWEKVYGWSAAQAAKMDGSSSEVRLYHVAADGSRREIGKDEGSKYEFGYGGTGPHESARAIVEDVAGETYDDSPARLQELVPEVFGRSAGHDDERCIVRVADVKSRLLRLGAEGLSRRGA